MNEHKNKNISYFLWIALFVLFGISLGYLMIMGSSLAYRAIYNITQELILKNTKTAPPNVAENSFTPSPKETQKITQEINNNTASLKIKEVMIKTPEVKKVVSMGFVGDIVPGINAFDDIFSEVTAYTSRPDIMIGNFEGVVAKNNHVKCRPNSINCYSFNGDSRFLDLLSDASFNVLNVANNHFNDYGAKGQEETLEAISSARMIASGVKDDIIYLKKSNIRIGIVGFSTYSWTTDMNDLEKVNNIIAKADKNADIVIAIFHGGSEGVEYANTPTETEIYLGENRGNLRLFGHEAIDAGADIVIGSGPHVLRGIERYNDKLIAYSLGNFASANSLSTSGSLKTSAMLEITFDKYGSFDSGRVHPFEIDTRGMPHPDPDRTGISAINELSKSDFGQQAVMLNFFGNIIFR